MSRFRPELSSLEDRAVPAGNVSAFVSGGDLNVVGDNAGNSVSVYQMDNGDWVVAGNTSNGSLTTVNNQTVFIGGHAYSFQVFDGDAVYDDVDIDLNGGNDKVELYGNYDRALVPDDLRIDTDGGHDTVTIHNVWVGNDAYIRTGSGNDTIYVENVYVGYRGLDGGNNDLEIHASTDYDRVTLRDVVVQDDLRVTGEQYVSIGNVYVGGDWEV